MLVASTDRVGSASTMAMIQLEGVSRDDYRSLFLQGRGGLERELLEALRTGRTRRRPRGYRVAGRGKGPDMVMINQRPPEVEARAVPGHWEGDLIILAAGQRRKHQPASPSILPTRS